MDEKSKHGFATAFQRSLIRKFLSTVFDIRNT